MTQQTAKTVLYKLGNKLYLNITNACPCSCVFCIRNHTSGVGDAESLWLEREPSVNEVIAALNGYCFDNITEIVFCGFGEPLERADDVVQIAQHIKSITDLPLRLNTNGLVTQLHPGFDVARLTVMDTISISLNADDANEYQRLTQSRFGSDSYDVMLEFAKAAAKHSRIVMSVIGDVLSETRIDNCRQIAASMGAEFHIRNM